MAKEGAEAGPPDEGRGAALKAAARAAPAAPGCYLMRGAQGRIIYVGKAKSLRKRLVSYFSGTKDLKTATLLRHARSIETIIVSNEYEALLLENTLIKQHAPKYNIDLKDGKSYPVIRVTNEEFPRIIKTRHIVEDDSRYFGPYANVHAVDTMLDLIDRLFMLRKCKRLKRRRAPCMYYHIKRCGAPCAGFLSAEGYGALIEKAALLLSGDTERLVFDLTAQMHEAARAERFEQAAALRDRVRSIEDLSATNAVVDFDPESRDYISLVSEGVLSTVSVFSFRGGRLTGRELFPTRSASAENESLVTFIAGYYAGERPVPAKIITETPVDSAELRHFFEETRRFAPAFKTADGPRERAVLNMAALNAREDLRKRLRERGMSPALAELQQALGLEARPVRIEGFDIAQVDGTHPVASLVSFKNGRPDKKNYRYFKLKTVVGIVDDYAAIREAVRRRYSRLAAEKKPPPDFILIDGGPGQVSAAEGVLRELGVSCGLAGLAKRDEEVWPAGARKPLRLPRRGEALKLLQAVRDETHRFATGLNRRLRSKDIMFGALESVTGIGPARAQNLITTFGSLRAVADAEAGEIARRCALGTTLAKRARAAARLALRDAETEARRLARQDAGGRVQP